MYQDHLEMCRNRPKRLDFTQFIIDDDDDDWEKYQQGEKEEEDLRVTILINKGSLA